MLFAKNVFAEQYVLFQCDDTLQLKSTTSEFKHGTYSSAYGFYIYVWDSVDQTYYKVRKMDNSTWYNYGAYRIVWYNHYYLKDLEKWILSANYQTTVEYLPIKKPQLTNDTLESNRCFMILVYPDGTFTYNKTDANKYIYSHLEWIIEPTPTSVPVVTPQPYLTTLWDEDTTSEFSNIINVFRYDLPLYIFYFISFTFACIFLYRLIHSLFKMRWF